MEAEQRRQVLVGLLLVGMLLALALGALYAITPHQPT
jgi:hypothetical protein